MLVDIRREQQAQAARLERLQARQNALGHAIINYLS